MPLLYDLRANILHELLDNILHGLLDNILPALLYTMLPVPLTCVYHSVTGHIDAFLNATSQSPEDVLVVQARATLV